jgi:hypothetical protein
MYTRSLRRPRRDDAREVRHPAKRLRVVVMGEIARLNPYFTNE